MPVLREMRAFAPEIPSARFQENEKPNLRPMSNSLSAYVVNLRNSSPVLSSQFSPKASRKFSIENQR
jgi:hypothetical protein